MISSRSVGISGFNFLTEVRNTEQNTGFVTNQAMPYPPSLADKIDHWVRYLEHEITNHLKSSGKENEHIPGNKLLHGQLIRETTDFFLILNTEVNDDDFPRETDKETLTNDINSLIEAIGRNTDTAAFQTESEALLEDLRQLQMNV